MVKPSETPFTMLLARARAVPHCMRARRLSLRGLKVRPASPSADLDVVVDDQRELAALALDLEGLALEVDGDALRDGDRVLADFAT